MSNLVEVLSTSEFTDLTDQECADLLTSTVILSQDNTRYSYQGVADILGSEVAGTILALLKQSINDAPAEMKEMLESELFSFRIGSSDGRTGGLIFSRPERQYQMDLWITALDGFGQTESANKVRSVKNLGITYGKKWQKLGLVSEPSLSDVTTARNTINGINKANSLIQIINNHLNANQPLSDIKSAVQNEIGSW